MKLVAEFFAGTNIFDAAKEACEFYRKTRLAITLRFNGTDIPICDEVSPKDVVIRYWEIRERD